MTYSIFHIVHLAALFSLVAVTAAAFSSPMAEKRKVCLMLSGIFSLLVLLTGFGLLGILKLGVPGWSLVKLLCWLVLPVLSGLVFRKPELVRSYWVVTAVSVAIALTMVSLKPSF